MNGFKPVDTSGAQMGEIFSRAFMKHIIAIVCGIILAFTARAAFSADASTLMVSESAKPSVTIAPAASIRTGGRMIRPGLSTITDGLSTLFWEIVKVEQETSIGSETVFEGPQMVFGREKSYLIPYQFMTGMENVYILPGFRALTSQECSDGNCASATKLLHCIDFNDLAYLVSTNAGQTQIEFVPYGFVSSQVRTFLGTAQSHSKTVPLIAMGESYVIVSRTPDMMIWEEESAGKRITFKKRSLSVEERIADCVSAQ